MTNKEVISEQCYCALEDICITLKYMGIQALLQRNGNNIGNTLKQIENLGLDLERKELSDLEIYLKHVLYQIQERKINFIKNSICEAVIPYTVKSYMDFDYYLELKSEKDITVFNRS